MFLDVSVDEWQWYADKLGSAPADAFHLLKES